MGQAAAKARSQLSQCGGGGRCPIGSDGERDKAKDPWVDPSKGMVGNPYRSTPTSSPFLGSMVGSEGSLEYDDAEPPSTAAHGSPSSATQDPPPANVENTALASLINSRLVNAGGEAPEAEKSVNEPTRSRRQPPKKIAEPPKRTMSVDRSVMLRKTMPPPEASAGSCFSCSGVKEAPEERYVQSASRAVLTCVCVCVCVSCRSLLSQSHFDREWRSFVPNLPGEDDDAGKSRLERKMARQNMLTEKLRGTARDH